MKNNILTKERHLPKIQFNIEGAAVDISIIENPSEISQPNFRGILPDDYIELAKHFQVRKTEFEEIQKEKNNTSVLLALKKEELTNLKNGLLGSFFNKTEIKNAEQIVSEISILLNEYIEVQNKIRVEMIFNLGLEQTELMNQSSAAFQLSFVKP